MVEINKEWTTSSCVKELKGLPVACGTISQIDKRMRSPRYVATICIKRLGNVVIYVACAEEPNACGEGGGLKIICHICSFGIMAVGCGWHHIYINS